MTVPIDESYYEDLKGLQWSDSELKPVRHLISVIHTSQVISEQISKRMKRTKLSRQSNLEMITLHYFTHSLHLVEAVYNLCIKGYGSAACILTRPMLEALINLSYLWLCKEINGSDIERWAWLEYDDIEKEKILRMTEEENLHREKLGLPPIVSPFATEYAEELRNRKEAFYAKYSRSDWAKYTALDARAREVDKLGTLRQLTNTSILLEGLYVQCYKWTSQSIHGSSSSTSLYTSTTDDKIVIDPRIRAWIAEASGMAAHFHMYISCLSDHILRTGVDIEKQLAASGLYIDG